MPSATTTRGLVYRQLSNTPSGRRRLPGNTSPSLTAWPAARVTVRSRSLDLAAQVTRRPSASVSMPNCLGKIGLRLLGVGPDDLDVRGRA